MPFFWKQTPTLEYLPKPVIYGHLAHETTFNNHIEKLLHNYGAQVLVNLIKHTKTEGTLEEKFRDLHKNCPLKNHVAYEYFDFYTECSRLRYDRLHLLIGKEKITLIIVTAVNDHKSIYAVNKEINKKFREIAQQKPYLIEYLWVATRKRISRSRFFLVSRFSARNRGRETRNGH